MFMKIAFYNDSSFDWNDHDLETRGVGGSQLVLINLSREFAKRHQVTVFNNTSREGVYHGVIYRNFRTLNKEEDWDVFISYRCAVPFPELKSSCKIHWSIDPGDNSVEKDLPMIDKIITISPFHTKMMRNIFHIHPDKMYETRLGIQSDEYTELLPKTKNKLIFCSAPERGLQHVPTIYSLIQQQIPDVSLVITMDYTLWGYEPDIKVYRNMFKDLKGVNYLGKIPRQQLIAEQKTSMLHIYPCDGPYEMFCLASLECQAAGTPTVATHQGALSSTVQNGETGVLIYSLPDQNPNFYRSFADTVIHLLRNPSTLQEMSLKARERALSHFSYRDLVTELEQKFNEWCN